VFEGFEPIDLWGAGVSAGTDMGFYLVSRWWDGRLRRMRRGRLNIDWRRDPLAPTFCPQQAATK
jgi:hypothetical protein